MKTETLEIEIKLVGFENISLPDFMRGEYGNKLLLPDPNRNLAVKASSCALRCGAKLKTRRCRMFYRDGDNTIYDFLELSLIKKGDKRSKRGRKIGSKNKSKAEETEKGKES